MAAKDDPVAARLGQADPAALAPDGRPGVGSPRGRDRAAWRQVLAHAQHRNAAFLILNMAAQAATGLLFWLVLTRFLALPPAEVGLGYTVIALGTTAAVVAKGGLDTALLRHAPATDRAGADGLLRLALMLGGVVAVLALVGLAIFGLGPGFAAADWLMSGLIAILLVATWLQDALLLAEGRTKAGTLRNLGASAVRILMPPLLVAFAVGSVVAVSWGLALATAAALGFLLMGRLPRREGPPAARRAFLASAGRNAAGSAAEFLPGLLLAPIVLATSGAAQAAYFGMAWTVASMLFLASAAISRSALAQLVNKPLPMGAGVAEGTPACIRRAMLQHVALVGPAAIALIALAPVVLGTFGAAYREASLALAVLAVSIVAVAPAYLYLALLRARDRALPLVAFPLAMIAALAILAPTLAAQWGLVGVAAAWLAANLPFGAFAAWRLHQEARGVMPDASRPLRGRAHLE